MRLKKIVGVYVIACSANGMQYVGSAANVRNRWSTHRWALRHGKHRIVALQQDWDQFGEAVFEFKVLAEVPDPELRRAIEQSYIDCILGADRAYNRSPSSIDNTGHSYTDDQRLTLSMALKGKLKSESHRAALSDAAARHWATVPEEQRRERMAEMGRGNRGKPKSEEHRQNIARGRAQLSEQQVREIKRRLGDGEATRVLAEDFGVHVSTISNIRRGRSWSHIH
jgi:group I intron endonuclease